MKTSSITVKGQVTIPADLRREFGLKPGDQVEFTRKGGKILIQRKENRVEAAFGMIKVIKGATLEDMEKAIAEGWSRRARR